MVTERLRPSRRKLAACIITVPLAASLHVFAYGQTSEGNADAENATLLARSQALDPARREEARRLFSTGFELWQVGDFPAAELALARGLAIDPANASANFYMGDSIRRRDRLAAVPYLRRAIAFGAGSPETFRAEAALAAAMKTPTSLDEMSDAEIREAFVGRWRYVGSRGHIDIVKTATGELSLSQTYGRTGKFTFEGRRLRFEILSVLLPDSELDLTLTSPNRLVGVWRVRAGFGSTSPAEFEKQR